MDYADIESCTSAEQSYPCRFLEALQISEEAILLLKISVGPDNPNVATALATKVFKNLIALLHGG